MNDSSRSSVHSSASLESDANSVTHYTAAVAFYEAELRSKPDRYAWSGRGSALLKLGQYEAAVFSYDQALRMRPDETAWCNRGEALRNLGRYHDAIASYDYALDIDPDFDAAFYGKACVYALQGRVTLALTNLQAAIACSPDEYRRLAAIDPNFDQLRGNQAFEALLKG